MRQTAQTPEREPFVAHWSAKPDTELEWHTISDSQNYRRQRSSLRSKALSFACFLSLALLAHRFWPYLTSAVFSADSRLSVDEDSMCPQVSAISPSNYASLIDSLDEEYGTKEFKLKAYESLGAAVRIPTVCYDDLGTPEEDPRWKIFYDFHSYIEKRFPKVHATLQRTEVATYALVYHWQGADASLKPLLLAAHIDVVPTNDATDDDWINPPFSGYYDGEWIWGRGSCDYKPGVIGSMTAIETLLERGFKPTRSIILAYGIDEERGGLTGAAAIGEYLVKTYGKDSISMIVDEGGGYSDMGGTIFAAPAVAEKGYLDVRMDVLTPGGHSSRPPKHTGIGILAGVVTELEANPHVPELARDRTYYQSLQCRAKYDAAFPPDMRKLVLESQSSDEKLRELAKRLDDFDPAYSASAGTTQAIDIIYGGVKVNALPEAVYAIANHRIADHSSVSELQDRFTNIVAPVAAKYNMSLDAFGKTVGLEVPTWGLVKLSDAFASALEPAPVTPTTGSGPYELLSGTVLSTLKTNLRTDNPPDDAVVTPGL
ncbi:hypothetical protein AZE42_05816, partial [Rhizopogon vesiculosus]